MKAKASPLRWRAASLPKAGNTPEEYEDAWAADAASGRFAVADGASESIFAALWARLLVQGFVEAGSLELGAWYDGARRQWAAQVMGLDLPWHAEMKREMGSFATFLGVAVRPPRGDRPGRVRAVAVGDSCLIRVRKERLRAFPIRASSEFGNDPRLLCSRAAAPVSPRGAISLLPGDQLFLVTDAIAEWFLRTYEQGGRPWDIVAGVLSAETPEAFAGWVGEQRQTGAMRNDDVTVLEIRIAPEPRE